MPLGERGPHEREREKMAPKTAKITKVNIIQRHIDTQSV